jgi:signal transduction histidine kinase
MPGAQSGAGMGLKIMKYRADMIGARFQITANQPHGTVITVTG